MGSLFARRSKLLAWSVWGLAVSLTVFVIVIDYYTGFSEDLILSTLVVFIYSSMGLVVASQRPENPIGWFLLSGIFFLSLAGFGGAYAKYALQNSELPGTAAMAWVTSWSGNLGFGIIILFTFLFFPDGLLPSKGWRPLAWFAIVYMLAHLVSDMFHLTIIQPVSDFALPFLLLACLAAVIVRYRRANPVVRQQIKWVAFSGVLGVVLTILGILGLFSGWASENFFNLIWITFVVSIPITLGIAILRYRLFDIDLIIRRTLVYAALTAILFVLYYSSVVLLQQVLNLVTGRSGQSQLSIVISTLGIAALFNPLRRRLQEMIDRRFYRQRYDAERTLVEFGELLRSEVDLEQINTGFIAVIEKTLQPECVSLWLRTPGQSFPQILVDGQGIRAEQ
jgi:hypothetical protein